MSSSGYKTCASCGSLCEPDASFCGHCGKQLGVSREDHPTIMPGDGQRGRVTQILDGTQFASTMHTPETTVPVYYPTLPSHRTPSTQKFLVVIGVLGVLLIGAVCFGLGQLVRSNTQSSLNTAPSPTNQSGTLAVNGHATPTIILPTSSPTATSVPTPTPTPSPTPTPGIKSGDILCQANGWQGWALSSDWKIVENNTLLVNDGSHVSNLEGPTAIPSCTVPDAVQNFAIEATITSPQPKSDTHFGLTVCGSTTDSGWQGYEGILAYEYYGDHHAQIWANTDKLAEVTFDPGTAQHTYRLAVRGNVITMFIDGAQVAQATDNKFLTCGRQVGLLSSLVVLNVSSFKLIAL